MVYIRSSKLYTSWSAVTPVWYNTPIIRATYFSTKHLITKELEN
jgi:hypothetical protein